MTVCCYLKHID